jgi:peroxiredoxin (alkyl hydroperoxide reductase subunit C)
MTPTIQKPAPAFTVSALVDGGFKQVSLADFLGQWYPLYPRFFFTMGCLS